MMYTIFSVLNLAHNLSKLFSIMIIGNDANFRLRKSYIKAVETPEEKRARRMAKKVK